MSKLYNLYFSKFLAVPVKRMTPLSPSRVKIDIPSHNSSSSPKRAIILPGAENSNPNIPMTQQTVKS